jgi:hypothetical protein
MTERKIKYFANNDEILSPALREYLEKAKIIALRYSNERDKMCLVFDNLRFDIIRWFSDNIDKEEC